MSSRNIELAIVDGRGRPAEILSQDTACKYSSMVHDKLDHD